MTDLLITMNTSGAFTLPSGAGRIEEYCAKRLKIKLNTDFLSSAIKYYTLSFEPYSLSRKIITENIYRNSDSAEGIYFADGYIFCPIYDYIAVSPTVMVQIDAYETDLYGNVTTIIKSGIFTLEFAPSLTGEGVMLSTVRPDVKFAENVEKTMSELMKTQVLDGANLIKYSVTGPKIAEQTIGTDKLQNNVITTSKIKDDAVTSSKLADESVVSEKIADNSITSSKLEDGSVTANKIADGNVITSKLADGSVTNKKLAVYSVDEAAITPRSVTTNKLADRSVTPAKLDRTYLTSHQSLSGYATEDWVKKQNYLKEYQSLDGYATEDWVEKQNYLKEHQSLQGYATEKWVEEKNYLTADSDIVISKDLPQKLSDLENDVAVEFIKQTLTDEQKNTVIENIGAVKSEEGKTLSQNDFTDADKEKLDKALTEHQDISMKADISSLSAVSFSGSYDDLSDLPENCGFTESLKNDYDKAVLHSKEKHAPVDAQENIIESVTVNGKAVEISDKNVSLTVIEFAERETIFAEVI